MTKTLNKACEAKPFVKWAGGKRQIINELTSRIPLDFNRYYEPFLGGGALFFKLQPKIATISDTNSELINAFNVIKNKPAELIQSLSDHQNDPLYYENMRGLKNDTDFSLWSDVEQASRFIYLNRTCFNGLYRLNSKGKFNTPFGKYKTMNFNYDNILNCSEVLNTCRVNIKCQDYTKILTTVDENDLVYFDPPYMPSSDTSNFTSYTKDKFTPQDQENLAKLFAKLSEKCAYVMLSNSLEVKNLYSDFAIHIVGETRSINSKGSSRGKIPKMIVTNF